MAQVVWKCSCVCVCMCVCVCPGNASPTQGSCMGIIFWRQWRWKKDPNSPFLRHLTPKRTLIRRFCAIWRHWGLKNDPKSPFLYRSLESIDIFSTGIPGVCECGCDSVCIVQYIVWGVLQGSLHEME